MMFVDGKAEEVGANPTRSRHCHRGVNLTESHDRMRLEGRGERRSGSQETPAVDPLDRDGEIPEKGGLVDGWTAGATRFPGL